jgi:cyclopropane fatty-acyl-phospholipid synthase-like methyltransferase
LINLAYYGNPPWDTGISPPEMVEFARMNPPGRSLDLGCGTGTNAIFLAQHGWEAWGIDFSRKAVKTGLAKAQRQGVSVHLFVGDVTKPIEATGVFDLILDIGCLHSISDLQRRGYFMNLMRLLAKDGHYLVYGFISDIESSAFPGLRRTDFEKLDELLDRKTYVKGVDPNGRRSVWVHYQAGDRS